MPDVLKCFQWLRTQGARRISMRGSPPGDDGFSLFEVLAGMIILGCVAVVADRALLREVSADPMVESRALATRLGLARLETVLSSDCEGGVAGFVEHWRRPENAHFLVPDLDSRDGREGRGHIVIDRTRPGLLKVEVQLVWWCEGERQELRMPMVVTPTASAWPGAEVVETERSPAPLAEPAAAPR